MHIVLRWDLSPTAAIIAAAHAPLGTYLNYLEDTLMQDWQRNSFIKVLHKSLNYEHWLFCKTLGEHRVFTESSLDNLEVSLGYRVVENPHYLMKEVPLWTF